MKTHKDLEVWKLSMTLVKDVYHLTCNFPKTEIYGLTSQIRRAAVSVPANITEGSARMSSKELRYFLRISFASLAELETLITLSRDLEFLSIQDYNILHPKIKMITCQLSSLIRSINDKIQQNETKD